ncbi:MAG: hypothetical protein AAFO94_02030 [Bacteroidota bacterium]
MSLSKRKSRIINVDNQAYRWSPSLDSGFVVLVVQHHSGHGSRLEIIISDDKHIVIENGSYSISMGEPNQLIITPALVALMIRSSLELGWQPEENGPPLQLTLSEAGLVFRHAK